MSPGWPLLSWLFSLLSGNEGANHQPQCVRYDTQGPGPCAFWPLLCSQILPVPCTVLAPTGAGRPQIDEGVGGMDAACSHTSPPVKEAGAP